jgi:hypothetical protein
MVGKMRASERVGRTSGITGRITYDKTTVNLVWKIVKFREDCIGDPIGMPIDAREQNKTPAKERFTIKVILRNEHKPNEEDHDG